MNQPDSKLIESRFKESIDAYNQHGRRPGGFLEAVLENNLTEAFQRADEGAMDNLRHIVAYVYWEIPAVAHGSPARVASWIKAHEDARAEGVKPA